MTSLAAAADFLSGLARSSRDVVPGEDHNATPRFYPQIVTG